MSEIEGRSDAGPVGSRRGGSLSFGPGNTGRTSPAVFAASGLATTPGVTAGRFTAPEGSAGLGAATSGILARISAARGRSADPIDGIAGLGVAAADGLVTAGGEAAGGELTCGAIERSDGGIGADRGTSAGRGAGLATAGAWRNVGGGAARSTRAGGAATDGLAGAETAGARDGTETAGARTDGAGARTAGAEWIDGAGDRTEGAERTDGDGARAAGAGARTAGAERNDGDGDRTEGAERTDGDGARAAGAGRESRELNDRPP